MLHKVGSKVFKVKNIIDVNHKFTDHLFSKRNWYLSVLYKELIIDFDSGINIGLVNFSSLNTYNSKKYDIKLDSEKECINHINEIKLKMLFYKEEKEKENNIYDEKFRKFIEKTLT